MEPSPCSTTRNWIGSQIDWRRLNLLAHPEVTSQSRFPNDELHQAEFSRDRSRIAISFADRIEICDVKKLEQPVATVLQPTSTETPIALNTDGTKLAVGVLGRLKIFDVATGKLTSEKQAQSNKVFDIEFSSDGRRLVAVGDPDPRFLNVAVDSKQRQLSLMVWNRNDSGEWDLMQRPKFDGEPAAPIAAKFSQDGNRILLTNKARSLDQQVALVMKLVDSNNANFYKLESKSPTLGVVTSIFADSAGSTVVSSVASGNSNSMVLWSVEGKQGLAEHSGDGQFVDQFVSLRKTRRNRFRGSTLKSETVAARIEDLDLQGTVLAAVSSDKKLSIWNLDSTDFLTSDLGKPRIFGGHARPIVRCGILGETGDVITIANGINAEIIRLEPRNFVAPTLKVNPIGKGATLADQSSPTVTFECGGNGLLIGNDHGLVSYTRNLNLPNQKTLKWQVTAWQQQLVTPGFLFARSQRDLIYKYDLASGELISLYTGLSEVLRGDRRIGKIRKMVVSEDGTTVALQRGNGKEQIEVWDLATQSKTILDYSQLIGMADKTNKFKVLPQLAISPDGSMVAAGKVRFHVWDVATGEDLGNDERLTGFNGSNLSSLQFVSDRQLIAGQRKTIRLFDVDGKLKLAGNFVGIEGLPELINEPNIVSTRYIEGVLHAILRKSFEFASEEGNGRRRVQTGIQVVKFDLGQNEVISILDAPGFLNGVFESNNSILAISRETSKPVVRANFPAITNDAFEVLNIEARDIESYGGLKSTAFFNNIHVDESGKIVLQWNLRNRLDPGIRDYSTMSFNEDGTEGNLKLIANPIIQQVGCFGTEFLTLENQRIRRWKSDASFSTISPAGMMAGRYREFAIAKQTGLVVAISHDGKRAVTFPIGQTDSVSKRIPMAGEELRSVHIDSEGKQALFGTKKGSLVFLNLGNDEKVITSISEFAILELAASDDWQTILAISDDDADESTKAGFANVIRPDPKEGWGKPVIVRVDAPGSDAFVSGDISNDGQRLITGSVRGQVTLWNTKSQVGNKNSAEEVQDQRELLQLFQCQSEVVDVNIINSDTHIITLEKRATDSNGWLLQTSK